MPAGVAGFHGKEPLFGPSAKANTRCPWSSPRSGADIVPVYVSRTPSTVTLLRSGPWFQGGLPMATESACLLLTDISGYTGYLAGVELDHAQDILADLMNTIIRALRPAFRLAKLEGDAVFMYAIVEKLDGSLLLDTIERCYFGFRRRRRDVRQMTSCECNACVRMVCAPTARPTNTSEPYPGGSTTSAGAGRRKSRALA
jgi:hypothetical protein